MIKDFFTRFRGLTIIGIGTIISTGISGIFWLYLASLVSTEHYGEISYYLAMAGITTAISFLGAGNVLIVYTAKEIKIQPPVYFIVIILSLITAIVLFFINNNVYASINVIGNILFALVACELLGGKHYKKWAILQISQKAIMGILSIVLYNFLGVNGVILGIGLSYFPMSIFHVIHVFKINKIDFSLIKPRIGFITNSYSMDLARSLGSSTDKIIIVPLFGFAILGNYQLGIQILSLLVILPGILYQYILPHDATGTTNKKLKILSVFASVILAVLGVILAPIIIPVLFPKFAEAVQVVQIVSIHVIPTTINIIYASQFLAKEKSKVILIGSIIFVAVQISMIISLGKLFGVNGIAAALVLAGISETTYLILANKYKR